ncbi:hypothetical protein D5S18_11955 [Nocardia panacis]|uniref:Uncharacterized protein n=1 Tax=Nocardia panacis TaxID=2340916 RepID=A0A3A4K728_9NOCA|nr:hypothetical protein [Nocardia panacis]RJO76919.1 hypothetical protein D5S18_11955 [Nocardia panacis]
MSEERTPETPETSAEVVRSWNIPAGARVANVIRSNILRAIDQGMDDPQLVADLAVGPLVMALGQLEIELAAAGRRIAELEAALAERDRDVRPSE